MKILSSLLRGQPNVVRVGPKGYILPKEYKRIAEEVYNMPVRSTDVYVTSYQRSGTTMTQELVWLIANDLNYEQAAKVSLTHRYPFLERSMLYDEIGFKRILDASTDPETMKASLKNYVTPATRLLAKASSPRFIKTHLPMSLLPPSLLDTAKVVYVARDPRDVIVSSFHHSKLFKVLGFLGDFKNIWKMFRQDLYLLTPYFEHVKEAWALRNHPNMLFLFYEDLSKDLPASVRRVAKFFGKELTEEQVARLCDHLSIENCKKNLALNLEDMRSSGILDKNETFIRKGISGGWRDYFDEDMTRQADSWIMENLRDSDLRFPSVDNK